jgi:hypothetical protein
VCLDLAFDVGGDGVGVGGYRDPHRILRHMGGCIEKSRESLINLVIFVFVADVKRKARLNTHVPNHVIAPGAFKPDQTKLMELRRTLNLIMKTVGRDSF